MGHLLVGIKMKPALAVMLLAAGIPRHYKALHSTVRKWNQVLLQRIDSEGVGEIEVLRLAVGAIGANVKLAVLLEEAGSHAVFRKVCVVEVSQDGGIVGHLHRLGVVRRSPGLHLLRMALRATLLANIGGG